MFNLGSLWGVLAVIAILAVVIIWAIFHNRTSRREDVETEDATRRMYDEQERDDKLHE